MSPLPLDVHDFLDTESDSDASDVENPKESIPEDDNDEDWEDEPESEDDEGDDEGEVKSDNNEDFENDQPVEGIMVPPLLPIPGSLKRPNQSLCSTCKTLDLTPRRFVVLPGDPKVGGEADDSSTDGPNTDLGFFEDIRKKAPHCPFCRLVLAALGPKVPSVAEDGSKVAVTMAWNTDDSIRILKPHVQTSGYAQLANYYPEITMLANDAAAPAKKTQFVRFIKDQIDFGMVRNWLNLCRIHHGSACDESKMMDYKIEDPAKDIPHFRLIDVVDNCIIPAPHDSKYVALSYIWGRIDPNSILRTLMNNYKELEKPGVLLLPENHDRIPITIRDAMQVVRELDIRYLWVDSLCIIQDDIGPGGSKMSAISKMDLVYGAAYLTIWATAGTDANAGLPGVRPNTRGMTQPIEEVLPNLRLGFKANSQDYTRDAVYFTRAWTYQEQQFTRRCLLFVGGQVIYSCRKAQEWREDILFEDQKPRERSITGYDDNDIQEFEGMIYLYSALSLTFDSDIYDAFAGLNRYFKKRLRADLVHGTPNTVFDWFLLWTSFDVQKRRDKAPSWSWAGWIGQSALTVWFWYDRSITRIRGALRQRTWIIWYQRKAHDSEEVIRVWTPKRSSKPTSKPRNFYGGHIKDRFPIDCSQTVPTPRKLVGAPEYIEDIHNPTPGSGFLQFWTVSLVFKLSRPVSVGDKNKVAHFGIYGRSNYELGYVFLNPDWAMANLEKDHEFILLCEGRDNMMAHYPGDVDEEEGWRYRVMLIEWKGDWAERVSVGFIGKGDLNEALGNGPVWKEIILG